MMNSEKSHDGGREVSGHSLSSITVLEFAWGRLRLNKKNKKRLRITGLCGED